jgi:hypothetical protein
VERPRFDDPAHLLRSRRKFLQDAATLLGAATLAARTVPASAGSLFDAGQSATLVAVADTLVPGAAAARVEAYLEAMLAREVPLLTYRFVGFPLAAQDFYRNALTALTSASRATYGVEPARLDEPARISLVQSLAGGTLEDWNGPPQALVYFALRSDAIDAVYGIPAAYDRLAIPYMAHIEPPALW